MKRFDFQSGTEALSCLLCPDQDHQRHAGTSHPDGPENPHRQHLHVAAKRECSYIRSWIASFAAGVCPSSGMLVTKCLQCLEGADAPIAPSHDLSVAEAHHLLTGSRFVGGDHRAAPHVHEIGEAIFAVCRRIHSIFVLAVS